MTPPKDQAPGLVARLRDKSKTAAWFPITAEAADLIEHQAARIDELEGALERARDYINGSMTDRLQPIIRQINAALLPKTLHDTPPHKGLIREQWKPEDEG